VTSTRSARSAGEVLAVPVCSIGSNALAYLLLLGGAHALHRAAYGELVALLGVLLVGTVPSLALQTVTARRVATASELHGLCAATVLLGAGAALVLIALSPPLASFLHLPSVAGLLWIAAALPATAAFGTVLGVQQGSRRFWPLAWITFAQGAGRSGGGLVGLQVGHTAAASAAGVAIGSTAMFAAARMMMPRHARLRGYGPLDVLGLRSVVTEVGHAAHAYGAFLVLASMDVLLARHVLSADEAGLYGAGSVITRAALWLPQSIVLLVFARMTHRADHHRVVRRAGGVVVACGVAAVLGVAMASDLVVAVLGGKYLELTSFGWLYALVGAFLAIVQFGVLAGLAVRRAGRIVALWLAMAAEIVAVLLVGPSATPLRVVATVATVVGVSAAVTFGLAALGRERHGSADQPVSLAGHGPGKNVGSKPSPKVAERPVADG
jgi:O-antigen/teichoic acid export membrane protein